MSTNDYIDITGCDLIALVKKAYALSRPQGMGMLHFREGELSDEDAQRIVNSPRGIDMDYVHGRSVKFYVYEDGGRLLIHPRWYDHSQDQLRELLASIGKELPAVAA